MKHSQGKDLPKIQTKISFLLAIHDLAAKFRKIMVNVNAQFFSFRILYTNYNL